MAVARLARLTLFSGPQCSLCEARVLQVLATPTDNDELTDCQGRISQSEETGAQLVCSGGLVHKSHQKPPARLPPGGHQYSGQGPRKVEEEIRLLDTRAASRRKRDSQGSLGCLDSARGTEATGSEPRVPTTDGMIDGTGDCFAVDTTCSIYLSVLSHSYLYDRIPGITLGEERDERRPSAEQDLRLCFNCGSPDHAVASCPEPIDREVVALSRQLFNFHHPDLAAHEITRFYVAEEWRQQRLQWLGSYEPGVIRGTVLREALGLGEGDPGNAVEWLRNMAYWGYPPGWVSTQDPRREVSSRILDDKAEAQATIPGFTIFGGLGDNEEIDLRLFTFSSPSTFSPATSSATPPPTRWATYPNTYFSSAALSIYNGTSLGSVASLPSRVSATFTPERRALWGRILSGSDRTPLISPWRLPGAFSTLGAKGVFEEFIPPPPSTTPPPLPPLPNSPVATIGLALSRASTSYSMSTDNRSIVDMDLSDDSE